MRGNSKILWFNSIIAEHGSEKYKTLGTINTKERSFDTKCGSDVLTQPIGSEVEQDPIDIGRLKKVKEGLFEIVEGLFEKLNFVVRDIGCGLCVGGQIMDLRERKFDEAEKRRKMGREFGGETIDVFGSGNERDLVTLLSNKFGEFKKRNHMAES
uniref:Uncharacterized protein n=1 Tax=Cucumis sativus TaxID=3659 RepID=A0A0A0KLR0_CUCSA